VPGGVSEHLDDQLGGEFRRRIVEFGWEGCSHGSCLLDQAGAGGLAEVAEGLAEDVVVQCPVGNGRRFDGNPRVGIARCLECKHVIECARLGVTLGERRPEIPALSQGRDQRRVAVFLVVDRARLDPRRDHDCRDAVAGTIERKSELAGRRGGIGRRGGPGRDVVVCSAGLVPPDQ